MLEWTTKPGIDVERLLQRIGGRKATVLQILPEIVPLHAAVGERCVERALEGIAAVLGDDIDPHTALRELGVDGRGVDGCLLGRGQIHADAVECSRIVDGRQRRAVLGQQLVAVIASVNFEARQVGSRRSTHILRRGRRPLRHPGNEQGQVVDTSDAAPRRNRVNDVVVHHALTGGALHIDDR